MTHQVVLFMYSYVHICDNNVEDNVMNLSGSGEETGGVGGVGREKMM